MCAVLLPNLSVLTLDFIHSFEEQSRLQSGLSKWVRGELGPGGPWAQLCGDIAAFVARLCPEGLPAPIAPVPDPRPLSPAAAAAAGGGGGGGDGRSTPTKRKVLILDFLQPKRSRVVDFGKQ